MKEKKKGKNIKIEELGEVIWIDRKKRWSIKLKFMILSMRWGKKKIEIEGLGKLNWKEGIRIVVKKGNIKILNDEGKLGIINIKIRNGGGDNGMKKSKRENIDNRGRMRMEGWIGRWRRKKIRIFWKRMLRIMRGMKGIIIIVGKIEK